MHETSYQCRWYADGSADGVRMECGWSADGVRMECGWSADGVRMECGWSAYGARHGARHGHRTRKVTGNVTYHVSHVNLNEPHLSLATTRSLLAGQQRLLIFPLSESIPHPLLMLGTLRVINHKKYACRRASMAPSSRRCLAATISIAYASLRQQDRLRVP
jgi:hypothetical protein